MTTTQILALVGAIFICFIGGYLWGRNDEQREIGFRVAEVQQKLIHAQMEKCREQRQAEFYKAENISLTAERDALLKSVCKTSEPIEKIEPRGIVE